MARVTVEDCVLKVPNRFELVMLASQRARDIGAGSPLTVERDNDKNTVVSLREIADTEIDLGALRDALVRGHQKVMEIEEAQDEILDVMEGEAEWAEAARQDAAQELSADLADEAEEAVEPAAQAGADDASDDAV